MRKHESVIPHYHYYPYIIIGSRARRGPQNKSDRGRKPLTPHGSRRPLCKLQLRLINLWPFYWHYTCIIDWRSVQAGLVTSSALVMEDM